MRSAPWSAGRLLPALLTLAVTGAGQPPDRPASGAARLGLRLQTDATLPFPGTLELHGLSDSTLQRLRRQQPSAEEWRRIFAVFTSRAASGEKGDDLPPLLGDYLVEQQLVRFVPTFPFRPGLPYEARLDRGALLPETASASAESIRLPFVLAARDEQGPATRILAIYPTAVRIPANQLKFTIQFSAPMSRGEAYRHLRLVREPGEEVPTPFLEIEQELWDPETTTFTLLLHPGRIKRGLRPHQELGAPLEEGESYRLIVDGRWRDGNGRPLGGTVVKAFEVGPPDRAAPDVRHWKLIPPAAGSRSRLRIRFPEPLDHELLGRLLQIRDEEGHRLGGEATIEERETGWSFVPAEPWRPGATYTLLVDPVLEDLAGNNLRGLFDVELGVDPPERPSEGPVRIEFRAQDP